MEEDFLNLQIQNGTKCCENSNQRHNDASNHLRYSFNGIALHGDNYHEARTTLEDREKIGIPASGVMTEHVSRHHQYLE